MWFHEDCIDLVAESLRAEEARLRDEQAVYGLDALDEVSLHPIVARGLAATGWGVIREQPYPTTWKKRNRDESPRWRVGESEDLPLPRERERCDLALTSHADVVIADEVSVRKSRRAARVEAQGTLFEPVAQRSCGMDDASIEESLTGSIARAAITPRDAMWIEIKTIGQYEYADGVPGPNSSYASRLVRSIGGDIAKLAGDAAIEHAGALLLLFTSTEETAEHDLLMLAHRCLDRGLPIASPVRRVLPIQERIGNRVCNVVMFPVKH